MFGPEKALRLGYLDHVVDDDQLDERVLAEASRLRQLDMPRYTATKARINDRVLVAIRAGVEAELGGVDRAASPGGARDL